MKNPDDKMNSITRREFVRTAALAATAVGTGLGLQATSGRAARRVKGEMGLPRPSGAWAAVRRMT